MLEDVAARKVRLGGVRKRRRGLTGQIVATALSARPGKSMGSRQAFLGICGNQLRLGQIVGYKCWQTHKAVYTLGEILGSPTPSMTCAWPARRS